MKQPVAALCLSSSLALLPAYSFAGGGVFVCSATHFVRAEGGTELRTTKISLRNLDLVNPTTVARITILNAYGDVVHDSGPATTQAHPLNTDFTPALDITVVPPGANYHLSTNHIWGSNDIPPQSGQTPLEAAQGGQTMSAIVQFSKEGKSALFVIGGTVRSRDRFDPRATRSEDSIQCTGLDGG